MQPKAFIFDLDGVLTSTDKYHFLAWKQLADRLGLDFTETVNEKLKGVDRLTSLEIILAHNGVSDKFSDAEKANRYANTDTVKRAIGHTQLHKIVVVYKGMEMRVCEEVM